MNESDLRKMIDDAGPQLSQADIAYEKTDELGANPCLDAITNESTTALARGYVRQLQVNHKSHSDLKISDITSMTSTQLYGLLFGNRGLRALESMTPEQAEAFESTILTLVSTDLSEIKNQVIALLFEDQRHRGIDE